MVNIDSQMVVALIALVSSVVSALVTKFFERRTARFSVYLSSLKELYVPLEVILDGLTTSSPMEALQDITTVIRNNYASVPPPLMAKYHALSSCSELSSESFDDFRAALDSYYNWHRRLLGYPYSDHKIIKGFTLSSRNALSVFFFVLCVFWCLVLFLMAIGVLPFTVRNVLAVIALAAQPFMVPYILSELIALFDEK